MLTDPLNRAATSVSDLKLKKKASGFQKLKLSTFSTASIIFTHWLSVSLSPIHSNILLPLHLLLLLEFCQYIACMLLVAVGAILTQKVVRDNEEDKAIIEEQEREFNMKVSKVEKDTTN